MLIIIVGNVGSGKTALASAIAKQTPNREILGNYPLKLKNWKLLEPENLMKLDRNKKYLIIIDECYVWLESLTSGNKIERYLSYILFQSRKLNIDIIVTSQLLRRININFQEMEDLRIECSKDTDNECFNYLFKFVDNNIYHEDLYSVSFKNMKKLCDNWNLYETMQVINPPEMQELALQFIIKDKNKLNKLIDDIINELELYKKPPSMPIISDGLLKLGYPQSLAKTIFNRLVAKLE